MSRFYEFLTTVGARSRSGVTLLEVLMAMGVMVVGLMGLASLIPLGRLELAEGNRLDNTSTLGRAAFRDITVHGYLRPEMWVDPTTGQNISATNGFKTGTRLSPPVAPIVIDPLMCAPIDFGETINQAGPASVNDDEAAHRRNVSVFPYSLGLPNAGGSSLESQASTPKIARVSLRSFPTNVNQRSATSLAYTMRYDVASRLFRSNDDLNFAIPTAKDKNPTSLFVPTEMSSTTFTAQDNTINSAGSLVVTKTIGRAGFREYKGDYSWFMIAEPSLAECWCDASQAWKIPALGGPTASPFVMRQFRVWVVVCNKRDLRSTAKLDLGVDPAVGERMAWVDFLDRFTARIRVSLSGSLSNENVAQRMLDLKTNSWIAVIGRFPNNLFRPDYPSDHQYEIEWYRIVNVADQVQRDPSDSSMWYREATVAGREFDDPTLSTSGVAYEDIDQTFQYSDMTGLANPKTGWGVIISGARGVYEKTIYIDRPSLYSPDY